MAKSFSTTVRLTEADAERCDALVSAGLYPSKPRLVLDAVRDLYIDMQRDLALFYSRLEPDATALLAETATSEALRAAYLEGTGFAGTGRGKPSVTINLKDAHGLLVPASAFIKEKLDIPDLFTVCSLALFLKLPEMERAAACIEQNRLFIERISERELADMDRARAALAGSPRRNPLHTIRKPPWPSGRAAVS